MTRVCRVLWVAVLVASTLLLGQQISTGLKIDTSFTAMVPLGKRDPDRSEALEAARNLSDQAVVLLLHSDNQTQLETAATAIHKQLAAASDLLSVSAGDSLPESLLGQLSRYPHNFLSSSMLELLENQNTDAIVEQRIDTLLAPTGELAVLDFSVDPFNTLGDYVSAAIDTASGNATFDPVRSLKLRLHGSTGDRAVQARLETLFDDLDETLERDFTETRLLRSGVFFFAREAATAAKRDINFISAGSLLGTLILLVLVFRSLWPLLVPVISIAVGVVFAFSVVHALYGNVHVFSIVFGASLIGIVIDYSIHYFYHSATGKGEAAERSQAPLHRALMISLLTSVVGYAALALAGIELLEKIALFSVAGVVASWLTVMSLAGTLSARLQPRRTRLLEGLQAVVLVPAQGIAKVLASVPSRYGAAVVVLLLSVGVVLSALLLQSDDDPRSFIRTNTVLLAEHQQVMQQVKATESGRFLLVRGATEQAMFDSLTALYSATDLEEPASIGLISVLDWLPSPEQQQRNHALAGLLYTQDGAAEKLFTILGFDPSGLGSLRASHVAAAGKVLDSNTLFSNSADSLPTMVHQSANAWFAYALIESGSDSKALRKIAAGLDGVEYVDTVVESQAQLGMQRRASLAMLVAAYLVVGLLLFAVYRQRGSLRMLLVPASATLATLLVLVSGQVPVNIFHTMALFLILGLGMDYSVFLAEMGADLSATRQAILLSALTSMLSFGLLALSSVPVAQGFGLTVFLGSCFNLSGAFVMSARGSQGVGKG